MSIYTNYFAFLLLTKKYYFSFSIFMSYSEIESEDVTIAETQTISSQIVAFTEKLNATTVESWDINSVIVGVHKMQAIEYEK